MDKDTSQMEGIDVEVAAGTDETSKGEKERQNDMTGAARAKTDETAEQGKPVEDKEQEQKEDTEVPRKSVEGALPTRLHVGNLTRNITEDHLRMIFSVWGPLKSVEIAMDPVVQLPKGYAHLEFDKREDAENALDHMHGGQIDGNIVDVKFVHLARKRDSTPVPIAPRRSEPTPTHRSDHQARTQESDRRHSPIRYRRRSPARRHSRSPPRRRSPYRHRSRSPPPRRSYNGGYPYGNRGPSPSGRRRRSPYRPRRRSPSARYRRREQARSPPSKRSRRSSTASSSSMKHHRQQFDGCEEHESSGS